MLNISRICPRSLWNFIESSYGYRTGLTTVAAVTSNTPTSTVAAVAPTTQKKVAKKSKKRSVLSKELLEHISQNAGTPASVSTASNLLSPKSLKVTSAIPTSVYLIDKSVSIEIKEVLESEKLDLDAPAIEINPGIGLLTTELIQLGFKNLTCFEEQAKLSVFIKEELKVPVVRKNFFDLPRLHHVDKVDGGNRVSNLLNQVKAEKHLEEKGNTKKNIYVFGAIPHLSSINFTIKSLVTQKILYEDEYDWSNPIYYVALGPKAYWILTSSPTSGFFSYRPSAVTFQLLFKTTLLRTLSRKAFVPWMVGDLLEGRSKKFKLRNAFDPDLMYFLKIETNQEVIERLGRDNLLQFWYFVRQHLFSRKNSVIPELEQWIPGCGAKLIREGFTIYSQFGDLTPQEILDVYLRFISWPEFPGSSFLNAVEKFQSRMERQDEDVMDFHKIP